MFYASTFLSHSSTDKPLVEAVARELGRRGVLAWLDRHELIEGSSLTESLRAAIGRQTTVTVFLSEAAVISPWLREELETAFQLDDVAEKGTVVPVYLDNPRRLVASLPILGTRWLTPNGDRVDHLGIVPPTDLSLPEKAKYIAERIARGIYDKLKVSDKPEVIIYLDQRGVGQRHGEPKPNDIPLNVKRIDAPVLVFRPDSGARSPEETIYGDEYRHLRADIEWGLSQALGNLRSSVPRRVRILGSAQLGILYHLGKFFDRSTCIDLSIHNMDGLVFTNEGHSRSGPPETGNPHCESSHSRIKPIAKGVTTETLALILARERYVGPSIDYLEATRPGTDCVWVESGEFKNGEQVQEYVDDAVALISRFVRENGLRQALLFCGLPFNAVPMLSAKLLHVVPNIIFMEHRKDLKGASAGDMYVPLDA